MNANERSVIRAIRGPVTLITVGALFALNNFTPYRIDQTWPVILIVFGLLSLLGRGLDRVTPQPPYAQGFRTPQYPPAQYPASGSYAGSPYAQPAASAKGGPGASASPGATNEPGGTSGGNL